MNPFLNPRIIIPFIKNYIQDPKRIERLNEKKLENYKDKALRKILSKAFEVPVYKNKYKKFGINKNDIQGIEDLSKLPFISRQDLSDNYPDGVVSPDFNQDKGHIICTGGTTTKYCCSSGSDPVCTFTDTPSLLRGSLITTRENNFYNLNIRRTRFAHIGNFNPYKFDEVFEKNVIKYAKTFISFDNYLNIQASGKTNEIIEKLESFKPDVIISYPAIFQDLAYFKRKNIETSIKPKLLFVGGAMLDNYTRKYVESAFNCRMFNTYSSCESGAEIAFECSEGNWHIHSDFFHLEAVDENMNLLNPGERGRLVITKLWGTGTPIIRYTGMEDWITLGNGEKCSCGLKSPIFGKPVEGRVLSNIILPDGRSIPPSQFLHITDVLNNLKTFKVKKYQIIQNNINEILFLIEIDKDLKNEGPSFNEISKKIKKIYEEKIGLKIKYNIKEVDKIEDDAETGKPAPLVVSNINKDETCKISCKK
jgi:phenylacetate-CoA ligase